MKIELAKRKNKKIQRNKLFVRTQTNVNGVLDKIWKRTNS
jgi:hypothetical protein